MWFRFYSSPSRKVWSVFFSPWMAVNEWGRRHLRHFLEWMGEISTWGGDQMQGQFQAENTEEFVCLTRWKLTFC